MSLYSDIISFPSSMIPIMASQVLPLGVSSIDANGVYASYGYGGNGITFSFLAAQLLGDLIAGSTSLLLDDFAIDRP